MQFPIENIPQQSPTMSGLQQGLDIYQKMLMTMAMPEIMKTQQETAKADLQQKQLANQYYPDITDSEIKQRLAQTLLTNAQIPYTNAQTEETKEKTKLMPVEAMTNVQNALTAQQNAARLQQNRSTAYSLTKMLQQLDKGARDTWIVQNQDLYNWLLNFYANEAKNQMAGGQSSSSPSGLFTPELFKNAGLPVPNGFSQNNNQPQPNPITGQNLPGAPTGKNANLTLSPNAYKQAAIALMNNPVTDDDGNVIPPNNQGIQQQPQSGIDQRTGFPQITIGDPNSSRNWTPDQKQRFASMEAANNANIGPQLRNRKMMAISLLNVTRQPEIQKAMVELADPKYSGMLGKSKKYLEEHFKPADIAEYNAIGERLYNLLSGSFKGLESLPTSTPGMQASADFYRTVANDKAWVRDPQAQLIDTLTGMKLADAEARAIIQSSQPQYETYKMPEGGPEILEDALKEAQSGRKKANASLLEKAGLNPGNQKTKDNDQKQFPTKTVDGKTYIVAPDGSLHDVDELAK